MEIHVRKIITEANIKDIEIRYDDEGKDEIRIVEDAVIIGLEKKLTTKEAQQLNKGLNKQGLEIVMDDNGNVIYFN